jgi:arylsulfatase A-like enzyme
MGNTHISTPNLDKLAKSGTLFTRAYIQGSLSGAVCMPSRAMIMTGRSFLKMKGVDMKGHPVMGEILRQAGYVTFATGKWHNGQDSWLRSFELGKAVYFGGMANHFDVPFQNPTGGGKFEKYTTKGKHSSEVIADSAIEFLKGRAGGKDNKPFFLYAAFMAPHDPRDAPMKYRDKYYKNKPPLPKNFLPQHPFDNGEVVGRDENLAAWPRTKEVVQDQLAEYYALITHVDEQIGRILQALADSGELENTIIVFAADNGLALGSHGLLGKQSVYEHSVGVPLMFVGPGVPKDQKRDSLVYLLDIFPTLCDMTGVAAPKDLDGMSLTKAISGEKTKLRDSLYFNYKHLQRSVRKNRWKLIVYPQINYHQLFDLENDPDEMKNVADLPEHAKRVEQWKGLILIWEKDLGLDPMPLTVANPKKKEINLTGHKRPPDQWQPEWIRKKYFEEKK